MKELAALQSLGTLIVADTPITDAGLKELAAIKYLIALDLTGTKVTDAAVAEFQKALPMCKIKK
jgi:hypothetical protein